LAEHLDPEMKNLNKEFEGLSDKLDKAFNILTSKRLQQFKQIFISDIDIAKLKKINGEFLTDATLTDPKKNKLTTMKSRLFDFVIEFNEKKSRKELLIKDAKEILDRVLNAASHHSDNPLHRAELKEAIEGIKDLKEYLNN
jgi:hypothetical protein